MTLNFKMSELIYSETAVKHNINNMPDINSLDCMLDLIYNVLQPLRNKIGKPIVISSGYRNAEVNKLVGGAVDAHGSPKSQHCKGQAADITTPAMSPKQLWEYIQKSGIVYDQLILEYNQWVHVSFNRGRNRKQAFTIN